MELIVIIKMLCIIALSLFLTPCASLLNRQLQSSHRLGDDDQQLTLLRTLSRKLKLNEVPITVKEDVGVHKGLNTEMKVLSGKSHQKEAKVMHHAAARVGTRQEWIHSSDHSDSDPSQFFTMDYSHVRRRRPIHNKSLPIAP